uniref:Uncharacterized protein n=1 Tax=Gasterosteus aculeatus aculeatus TaxID=481459 RepID=G3NAI6_GASAC
AAVCGFMLKLYGGLEDPDFLLGAWWAHTHTHTRTHTHTHTLSGGCMCVCVCVCVFPSFRGGLVVEVPLPPETFGSLPWETREGRLIRVHPVFFNIGINQQQSLAERFGDSSLQEKVNQQSCERLRAYCNALTDATPRTGTTRSRSLGDMLSSLEHSLDTKKRKNVGVLWAAASVCREVHGVRLTSCKSAKDRTAMSVTLEQCALLRERHSLGRQQFGVALDCMRRDGCRMDNVQKNVGSRKFAFSGVQLLTFPRLYRPPDGSFG